MNIDPRLPEKSIFRFTWQKKMEKKQEKYMYWQIHCVCYAVRIEKHEMNVNECHIIVNAYGYSMNEWNNFDKHHIWVHFTIRCLDFLDDLFISKTLLSIFPKQILIWLIWMFNACPFACDHIILCTLLDIEENIFGFAFGNEHFRNKLFTLLMLLIHFLALIRLK